MVTWSCHGIELCFLIAAKHALASGGWGKSESKLKNEDTIFMYSVPRKLFLLLYEPRCGKTGLRGFRQGLTQTGLYIHRRWLEA